MFLANPHWDKAKAAKAFQMMEEVSTKITLPEDFDLDRVIRETRDAR